MRNKTMLKMKDAIDWKQCLELVNNKAELAKEMLVMFEKELPETKTKILTAANKKDYKALQDTVHQLHGACCYCCAPQLKAVVLQLEAELKTKNYSATPHLVEILLDEIEQVQNFLKDFL